MIKTLLVSVGVSFLALAGLHAAPGRQFGGGGHGPATFGRPAARPQYAGTYRGGASYRGRHGGYGGHRYFLGGVPYFYDPFLFGWGGGYYGYPYAYGSFYDNPYATGYYNGRVADDRDRDRDNDDGDRQSPYALPKAVQKQLANKGYYKGSIDGEFGPASKSALTRFQKDNDLRATGRIDPATMKALGFEDRD